MQQLFTKLDPLFYCTCPRECKQKACITNGITCFYLVAKTRRQLNTGDT